MFFTSKNTLVIALLIYRLAVLYIKRNETTEEVSLEVINGDITSVPESGTFRRTSELRRKLLSYYGTGSFVHGNGQPAHSPRTGVNII